MLHTFADHAPRMQAAGWAVLPAAGKSPIRKGFNTWRFRPSAKIIDKWAKEAPDADIVYVPGLCATKLGKRSLIVVDPDDAEAIGQAEELFGDTPGKVRTRRGAHRLTHHVVDDGRRRLLDQLLMAPLYRAFAFSQVYERTELVAQDLHLDVARASDVALQEDPIVSEGGARLSPRAGDRLVEVRRFVDDPHALAPGNPMVDAAAGSSVASSVATPQAVASSLAASLSPNDAMAFGGGPIHTRPAPMTAVAKSAFSAR